MLRHFPYMNLAPYMEKMQWSHLQAQPETKGQTLIQCLCYCTDQDLLAEVLFFHSPGEATISTGMHRLLVNAHTPVSNSSGLSVPPQSCWIKYSTSKYGMGHVLKKKNFSFLILNSNLTECPVVFFSTSDQFISVVRRNYFLLRIGILHFLLHWV